MTLIQDVLQKLSVRINVGSYVRIIARQHAATPLGMGHGKPSTCDIAFTTGVALKTLDDLVRAAHLGRLLGAPG
ncbi:hypothetical protein DUT91_19120 [Phyllobacterium salinisoli]|uniref:Uncharacterized protein n=1 Tax=Phyllobacterium salinisoli TaxID=1899321 RepID=A0A368JY94_9HYPH|nr:hypothetical protein [Phyllobacterium salinisoli]RCS22116.1 hypothetical protein DUT91_19120 [Phyllobacterium salinisoli]